MNPCTPTILEFQCAGDEKNPTAGCGMMWISVPWKSMDCNGWCPRCGNWSTWDADIAFSMADESCARQ